MKILIDALGIANQTDGAGVYAYQLLNALHKIDAVNEYLILVSNKLDRKKPIFELEDGNFKIKRVDVPYIGVERELKYLFKVKHKLHYDLFHCLNSNYPYFMNRNGICTILDLKYIKFPQYLRRFSTIKSRYLKWVFRNALTICSKVICISNSTKKDLLDTFGVEYEKKLEVIYLATSPQSAAEEINLKKCLGIKSPYFLFIGIRRPHKNLEGLLKAFAFFCKNYSDKFNLVITGMRYSDYDEYIKEIDQEIEERVIFTGFVPDAFLPQLYKESFAFLFPSFYEGFGIPILEAMQYKTPVITSNISSMPEVLGGAGLTVDPNDYRDIALKMNLLVENDVLRNELILKGQKRVQEFSWKKTARQTLEIYNSLYYQ